MSTDAFWNTDTFPLPVAFKDGAICFYRNCQINPYPMNTDHAKEWQRGFNHGYTVNLIQHQRRMPKVIRRAA